MELRREPSKMVEDRAGRRHSSTFAAPAPVAQLDRATAF